MKTTDAINIPICFPVHPATRLLKKLAGKHAALALVSLWCYAADHAPDNRLPHDPQLIATIAEWTGDPQPLIDALITAGFLRDTTDSFVLLDPINPQGGAQ
jgi:hypothetical protein